MDNSTTLNASKAHVSVEDAKPGLYTRIFVQGCKGTQEVVCFFSAKILSELSNCMFCAFDFDCVVHDNHQKKPPTGHG